jgi:protoheme IX farnesyltransferase
MLPVVAGRTATTLQILIYSALLFPISLLPWALGFAGSIYGATALVGGALFVVLAFQLRGADEANRRAAHRLFAFSVLYLFLLFAALAASPAIDRRLGSRPVVAIFEPWKAASFPVRSSRRAVLSRSG